MSNCKKQKDVKRVSTETRKTLRVTFTTRGFNNSREKRKTTLQGNFHDHLLPASANKGKGGQPYRDVSTTLNLCFHETKKEQGALTISWKAKKFCCLGKNASILVPKSIIFPKGLSTHLYLAQHTLRPIARVRAGAIISAPFSYFLNKVQKLIARMVSAEPPYSRLSQVFRLNLHVGNHWSRRTSGLHDMALVKGHALVGIAASGVVPLRKSKNSTLINLSAKRSQI